MTLFDCEWPFVDVAFRDRKEIKRNYHTPTYFLNSALVLESLFSFGGVFCRLVPSRVIKQVSHNCGSSRMRYGPSS